MVAPVTGPFYEEVNGTGAGVPYYWRRKWWRQKHPYSYVLEYDLYKCICWYTNTTNGTRFIAEVPAKINWEDLVSRAYDKVKDKVSDRAQLGTTFAELGQSTRMIAERATQLRMFTKAIKRFDFNAARLELQHATLPRGVSAAKSASNNWLEFHFGWEPLVKDIYSAVQVLQSPINAHAFKVRASNGWDFMWWDIPNHYTSPDTCSDPNLIFHEWKLDYKAGVQMGGRVAVEHPNIWLANQLGLVNPLGLIWELIPYSFVVDWFANVGQFLSSGSDFLGLRFDEPYTTHYLEAKMDLKHTSCYGVVETYGQPCRSECESFDMKGVGWYVKRRIGIERPTLHLKPYKIPGWKRALTAISLLGKELSTVAVVPRR